MRPEQVLDRVFAALADATRREVVQRLMRGPATVTELAQPHGMSLPGFMKHLRVLEEAGLVSRSKEGRVVSCEFAAEPMRQASIWLAQHEQFWQRRFDALGRYLYHQEEVHPWPATTRSTKGLRSRSPATIRSRRKKSGGPGPTRKRLAAGSGRGKRTA
jgi:DNA-binding transcriptional ArsR family regulator